MSAVISCIGASRVFTARGLEPVVAVNQAYLEVEAGEFVAIEGPSGSGKTTLLGLLAGIDRADSGTVSVLGHDLGRLSPTERARLRRSRLGIVFQSFGLVPSLDAGHNVALALTLGGMDAATARPAAAAALAEVGLEGYEGARVDELSGGERQRVGVARALVANPAVILADEPAGSLDEDNAAMVLDLLGRTSRSHHASLVLVTHDQANAARADRRIRMRDGRLLQGISS